METLTSNREPDARTDDPVARVVAALDRRETPAASVEDECRRLRRLIRTPLSAADRRRLDPLFPLLGRRFEPRIAPVFRMLEELAASAADPWSLLSELVAVAHPTLAVAALDRLVDCASSGALVVDRGVIERLAELLDRPDAELARPESLVRLERILAHARSESGDALLELYLGADQETVRRLAARLLDRQQRGLRRGAIRRLLGGAACRVLAPYVEYTRATHVELLSLRSRPGTQSPIAEDLARAERICGSERLREIVAELGWTGINLGLELRSCVGIRVAGSMPFVVDESEAALFSDVAGAERAFQVHLAIGHGGPVEHRGGRDFAATDRIAHFRALNETHAELLELIARTQPLARDRVVRILRLVDRAVADFVELFAAHTDECSILPAVWADLADGVIERLAAGADEDALDPALSRIVLAFEDPRSLAEVRTVHGLKRYLHQRGLQLGSRLIERGAAADRTVSLALTSSGALRAVKRIRYADFDPDPDEAAAPRPKIPFAVSIAAEAFAHQLVHGQERFPHLDVLCFGTEAHYFLAFWNHPALLRIAYAPPLRGGMIDLSYLGVSNYELATHPGSSLDGIRTVLARLGFEVRIDGTRIQARLDKERTVELDRVIEGAELMLSLAPYLMDLDWTIGSLDLDPDARRRVAQAWASRFALWGVLPLAQTLTADRRGILVATEHGATADREVRWSGSGAYRDGLEGRPDPEWLEPLLARLRRAGIEPGPGESAGGAAVGQLDLRRRVLEPLREALAAGTVRLAAGELRQEHPEFPAEHEARIFAEILDAGPAAIRRAIEVARLVEGAERGLRFTTTGALNGHPVERGRLRLREGWLSLFTLRDPSGVARLAFYHRGTLPPRRSAAWPADESTDSSLLARLLRRAAYLPPAEVAPAAVPDGEIARTRECFAAVRSGGARGAAGARMVAGLRAAPGRAVGRAGLEIQDRTGRAAAGRILFSAALGPESNTLLYHAAGVVSTGGGALSHAGLQARQLGKPALIVGGRWTADAAGLPRLRLPATEWDEEERDVRGFRVIARRNVRERELEVREGDLVVLDADAGALTVLGQRPEVLAVHGELLQLLRSARRLALELGPEEYLAERGRYLRALHQLDRQLREMTEPELARLAVQELLLGTELPDAAARPSSAALLGTLVANPRVGPAAAAAAAALLEDLERGMSAARRELEQGLVRSTSPFELQWRRAGWARRRRAAEAAAQVASASGLCAPVRVPDDDDVDARLRGRLGEMRDQQIEALGREAARGDSRLRCALRRIERLDAVLGRRERAAEPCSLAAALRERERASVERVAGRRVLRMREAAWEHAAFIGWKAANLAELRALCGERVVPPWFAVTDRALRETLETGPAGRSLRLEIDALLEQSGVDDERKAAGIRAAWDRAHLPRALADEVVRAYRELLSGEAPPFVAVRSSSCEEDAEAAARAGEFETFLFVRGEESLLDHLKRAWAGFWSARALHNRRALGLPAFPAGGGIVIQRMVASRSSGVLHTVNVAREDPREIVIDAGLGLGRGVVEGSVEVDRYAVSKPAPGDPGPLRFHCSLAEKRRKVVLDPLAGSGTVHVATLSHEGLRPALEYADLADLVRIALDLEEAYGLPLDLEFAIEEQNLWIVQVRPIPVSSEEARS